MEEMSFQLTSKSIQIITTTYFFREDIPDKCVTSSKTIIKVQLGFVNISFERDNIMTKYVLSWSTAPSTYFTCIWNKIWTKSPNFKVLNMRGTI